MNRLVPTLNRAKHFALIVIGVPFLLLLTLADAACAAWDECRDDWRDIKSWVADTWNDTE
jgi:hypothetical protein